MPPLDCVVLMLDQVGRQGRADRAGAPGDQTVARLSRALEDAWPGRTVLVSRSPHFTDARRLREEQLASCRQVIVVRPTALLLPADVLPAVSAEAAARGVDLAVLAGLPSDVFYVASARAVAVAASLGGVPGCVTLPQAAERLAGAGATIDGTPLAVARLMPPAAAPLRDLMRALPPDAWRPGAMDVRLDTPPDRRLAEAVQMRHAAFQDARDAIVRARSRPRTGGATRRRAVLVVVPSMYQSGAHSAWAELSAHLSPRDVAFVVARGTVLRDRLVASGFTVVDVVEGLGAASAADAAALLAALDELRPAVVHFDGAECVAWAPAACARGLRVVQHVRLNDVDRFRPAFPFADAVVGVSPHVCHEIELRAGPGIRVEHIPDGVCLDARPPRQQRATRTTHTEGPPTSLDGRALVCLCVGRVEPAKDQLRVLDIAESLARRVRCRLVLAGPCGSDPAYCDEVLDRIDAGRSTADITWVPFLSPMTDHYAEADVVLVASRNEALGMVGLEALAAGRLLVAQRSTGYERIVDPDRSEGILFDSHESADEVAERIVAALPDGPTFSANARRKAAEAFDARVCAQQLERLWRQVRDA